MQMNRSIATSKSDPPPDHAFLPSTLPPSRQQKRFAIRVLLVLLLALLITAPFAQIPLANTDILLPAYATAVLVNDLITAALLFALYSVQPSRALLALSIGYLFAALTVIPWALTFPGVFAPSGLLGSGLQSTASIAAVRRVGFPLCVVAYALLKDGRVATRAAARGVILTSVLATIGVVCALTWLVVASEELLPTLMVDTLQPTADWQRVPATALLLSLAALGLLWARRSSVLDLWLMIVICASLIEIVLLAFLSAGRFSVGWWAGRLYGLASASMVLLVLLSEITTLYVRLLRSVAAERRAREARLATMEALSASIAHEVSQPLGTLMTNAAAASRWLDRATPDLAQARAALERIVTDGDRASSVVQSIRTMFRSGTKERSALDLNELIREVLGHTRAETQLGRVAVRTELDPALPPVTGNRVQLQQVVLNLVMNAVDAMSTVVDRPRTLRISSVRQEPGGVLVSVADAGSGVDPSHQGRIFEPFFTTKGHGMGMGLMLCRSTVEAHGGRLWMTPNEPHGTIFQFTLPASGA
jgi:signal transduction histidine kinase